MDFYSVLTYNGMTSRNPVLTEMMSDYIAKLERMSVVNLQDNDDYSQDMLNAFENEDSNINYDLDVKKKPLIADSVVEKADKQITFDKRVITENDLINTVGNRKEIIVPINTIITPLALDTAKKQGIQVIRR